MTFLTALWWADEMSAHPIFRINDTVRKLEQPMGIQCDQTWLSIKIWSWKGRHVSAMLEHYVRNAFNKIRSNFGKFQKEALLTTLKKKPKETLNIYIFLVHHFALKIKLAFFWKKEGAFPLAALLKLFTKIRQNSSKGSEGLKTATTFAEKTASWN